MILKRNEVIQLLYGEGAGRRFTQDSPVLPDVWIAFAEKSGEQQDLLLTPYLKGRGAPLTPAALCLDLEKRFSSPNAARSPSFERSGDKLRATAYNQAAVVIRLWFDELIRVILPLSAWWNDKVNLGGRLRIEDLQDHLAQERLAALLADPRAEVTRSDDEASEEPGTRPRRQAGSGRPGNLPAVPSDLLWTIRVAGTISLANQIAEDQREKVWPPPPLITATEPERRASLERRHKYFLGVVQALAKLMDSVSSQRLNRPLIHLVTLNREAKVSISRSTAAVKADAAKTLFKIDCSKLTWAIIDSGIDASHPAFFRRKAAGDKQDAKKSWSERTRVTATYDFTAVRCLLSPDPAMINQLPKSVQQTLQKNPGLQADLRHRLQAGHDIDWGLLQKLIEVPHDANYKVPVNEHGTHVAGILAANWPADDPENVEETEMQGVCPDINLYDLRVLDDQGTGDEFSVMAALQFIRHLNAHKDYMVLQGVNLSLSIRHDVRNYACGRTPVCEECERLIGAGIVVIAAAGNEGYYTTLNGEDEGYRGISISDPGNTEGVVTVGSTHRDAPHTYGVSYFSSRGPTGDGRIKPDLVAPGEKIESVIPGGGSKRMDGTSQAAPHVSGVAALLMARHRELIGRPHRIKEILCQTATDLGRERIFQGHGLVDALRALQSV